MPNSELFKRLATERKSENEATNIVDDVIIKNKMVWSTRKDIVRLISNFHIGQLREDEYPETQAKWLTGNRGGNEGKKNWTETFDKTETGNKLITYLQSLCGNQWNIVMQSKTLYFYCSIVVTFST